MKLLPPLRHAVLIAELTLRDALRQRLFGLLLVLSLLLVVGARLLRGLALGPAELDFIRDCGCGVLTVCGAALTITSAVALFFQDVEGGFAPIILAGPVERGSFLAGKLIAVAVLAGVFCTFLTALLGATLWFREGDLMRAMPASFPQGRTVAYTGLALAGLVHWLGLVVLGAFVLLVTSYARTALLATCAGWLILLCGQLRFMLESLPSLPVFGRTLGGFVSAVVPNLHLFTLGGQALAAGDGVSVGPILFAGIGYTVLAGGLAAWSFGRREI